MEPEEPQPPVPPDLSSEAAPLPPGPQFVFQAAAPEPPQPPQPPPPQAPVPATEAAAAPPPSAGTAYGPPMMEFLQRRLESLEKDLLIERDRARSAQSALDQQQALRAEVETHLKAIGEQLRREKSERENEETKSHARGRIDVLEKRLDDMHQSFVSLLKEAISQRESTAQSVTASQSALSFTQADLAKEQGVLAQEQAQVRQEIAALNGTLRDLLGQLSQWRAEARAMTEMAPELRNLTKQVPEDGRKLELQVNQNLAAFSAEIRENLAEWRRAQDLESEKQDQRALQVSREGAALQRAFEEQNHAVRTEFVRESLKREADAKESVQKLHQRLDELLSEKGAAAGEAAGLNQRLERLLDQLTQSAPTKDQVIQSLEQERNDLLKALRERSAALKRFRDERLEIERTLGDSAAGLHQELDDERGKNRILALRVSELEAQAASWQDKIDSAKRVAGDQEQRSAMLMAEREQLAKAWHAEMEKARVQLEERAAAEAAWSEKIDAQAKKLAAETMKRADDDAAVAALRAQSATLTEQMARAIAERDAVLEKYAAWDTDRRKLMQIIKDKEELISMMNTTFQNVVLKKEQK